MQGAKCNTDYTYRFLESHGRDTWSTAESGIAKIDTLEEIMVQPSLKGLLNQGREREYEQ